MSQKSTLRTALSIAADGVAAMAAAVQSTRDAKQSKPILKTVLLIAGERRWRDVIAATADRQALLREPRLIQLRLEAALEEGDEAIVRDAVEAGANTPMPPRDRYATLRPLINKGRVADAWTVLSGDHDIYSDVRFLRHGLHLLHLASPWPPLRKEIKKAVDKARPVKVRPASSNLTFPINEDVAPRPLGQVDLTASPAVDVKHLHGLVHERDVFLGRLQSPQAPFIRELANVFLDRFGQIWMEDGTVVTTTGKPRPAVSRSDCACIDYAVSLLRGTRGIYHWLVDKLPSLSFMDPAQTGLPTILVNEEGPVFERETLAIAGFDARIVRPVTDVVFVRRLIMPSVQFRGMRDWPRAGGLFEAIAARAREIAAAEQFTVPDHIYISRRDSHRRPMVNEADFEREMQLRGYHVVMLAGMPLWQQIAILSTAKSIVGPHGAGLAHLIFAAPGTRLLEVLPIMDGSYALRFNYARLSLVLGHRYHGWLEPQLPRTDKWNVRMDAFLPFFEQWQTGNAT